MNENSAHKKQEFPVEPLSEREIQILELIADNFSKQEIAERLSLAYSTVKWYTQQTYQKLAVNSRREAVQRARELGWLKRPQERETTNAIEATARIVNPYKGLFAFQENDAADFFGRETLVNRLAAYMSGGEESPRFLAIVGPSGSGKSSLVQAGLIPALRQGGITGSGTWSIVQMIPGSHPFEALATRFSSIALVPSMNLLAQLQQDERGILRTAQLMLSTGIKEILLVIDQFEELFTQVEDKAETRHFVECLCIAVTDPDSPLRVVIVLRADFFDRLLQNACLSRLAQDCTEVVIPLTVKELERAIRAPAEQQGIRLEPGLVAEIVANMVDQPGSLPLLQYALTEIFEHRSGNLLALDAFQAIGGLRGVIERRAEEVFAGLSPIGKSAARQVFLRLVTLNEEIGTDSHPMPYTRRRVLRSELDAVILTSLTRAPEPDSPQSGNATTIAEVLDAFGNARLLYFDRNATTRTATVEVAHEALLSEWWRLRGWLEEEREGVQMQRALSHAAAEWGHSSHDASFLLQGTRLSLFENWGESTDLALTEEEFLFLKTSLVQRDALDIAEASRKKREARLERRARIFLQTLVIILLLATLASLALASRARMEANLATSRELAIAAVNNLVTDPERSILLSLQALRADDTQVAIDALHRAVQASRVRKTLTGFSQGACSVDFSPDGKALATASCAGEVTIWETGSWQKLFSQPGENVCYSPDGLRLAIGDKEGAITIWDSATYHKLLTLNGHHKWIDELYFSPDGKFLASTSEDLTFIIWNVRTGQNLFSSRAAYDVKFSPDSKILVSSDQNESGDLLKVWGVTHNWILLDQLSGYTDPVFSPDGRWLVSSGEGVLNTGIALWDLSNTDLESVHLSTIKPQLITAAHTNSILGFTFSPDSSLLASVSQDGTAKIWHLSDNGAELRMTLSGHTGAIQGLAFSPDGSRLATAGQDGTVRIWDITPVGVSEWFTFTGSPDRRYRMSLTKDGRYLATGSDDGSATIWDLKAGKQLFAITNHGGPLFTAGISPDGSLLATAGYDNVAKIWKLDLAAGTFKPEPILTLNGQITSLRVGGVFPGLTAAVFSPDGKRLAMGGVDGMARIWDVHTGKQLLQIQVHPDHLGVTSLAFSPDGRLLATASDGPNPLAKVWDASNGVEISTFSGHSQAERIWGLAFSPDGRRVATGAQGGGVKIWDAKTGKELVNLVGHTSTVVGVAFSPDGKYLASASSDGTARVWDAYSGEVLQVYNSPAGPLINIAFTPDGKRLVASGAGYIYGFLIDQAELVQLARSRLTRWFTPDECRRFLHQTVCPTR